MLVNELYIWVDGDEEIVIGVLDTKGKKTIIKHVIYKGKFDDMPYRVLRQCGSAMINRITVLNGILTIEVDEEYAEGFSDD